MGTPRKRCPNCSASFEGEGVRELFSCDQCGNGYLSRMPDRIEEPEESESGNKRLPRGGGNSGNNFLTRDGF